MNQSSRGAFSNGSWGCCGSKREEEDGEEATVKKSECDFSLALTFDAISGFLDGEFRDGIVAEGRRILTLDGSRTFCVEPEVSEVRNVTSVL